MGNVMEVAGVARVSSLDSRQIVKASPLMRCFSD